MRIVSIVAVASVLAMAGPAFAQNLSGADASAPSLAAYHVHHGWRHSHWNWRQEGYEAHAIAPQADGWAHYSTPFGYDPVTGGESANGS